MTQKNIFAYTEMAPSQPSVPHYPGYLSLNEVDGKNVLTVRGTGGRETAVLEMSDEQLRNLALQIDGHLLFKARTTPREQFVIAPFTAVHPSEDFELPAKPACDLDRPGSCESCQ